MKIDWKKLNYFRSLGREEMEGLLREVREKKDPAVPAADDTADTVVKGIRGN